MKKLLLFVVLAVIATSAVFAQAKVDNLFRQRVEISLVGSGHKMTAPASATTGVIRWIPKEKAEYLVKYLENQKYVEKRIWLQPVNGILTVPESLTADVVTPKKGEDQNAKKGSSSAKTNSTANSGSDYRPEVGQVNFIKGISAEIPSFHLPAKNKSNKDILFIGNVFTGSALRPKDSILSKELVRPGLIELTMLYKLSDDSAQVAGQYQDAAAPAMGGHSLMFAQQAVGYMVMDAKDTLIIRDDDFFDIKSLMSKEIRFKNIGNTTMYPRSQNKRLKPLKPGRSSKVIRIDQIGDLIWYFYDPKTKVQRLAIFEIAPDRVPIIKVRPMDDQIYGIGR